MPSAIPTTRNKEKAVSLKGDEAEEVVLDYMRKMNRPFAATDVSANLHGSVSKPIAQKALLALAQKEKLVKKDYGKHTIFVFPQSSLPPASADSLVALDQQLADLQQPLDEGKRRVRALQTELVALLRGPKTADLSDMIKISQRSIDQKTARLAALRAGAPPISTSDIAAADGARTRERAQWVSRQRTYLAVVDCIMGEATAEARTEWEEALGIEPASEDALRLEKSAFVASPATIVRPPVQGQSRARAGTAAPKRKASSIDEDGHAGGAPVQKLKAPVDA